MNRIIKEDIQQIINKELPWEQLYGKTILITGATGMLASYMVYTISVLNQKNLKLSDQIKVILLVRDIRKAYDKFSPYFEKEMLDIIEWDGTKVNIDQKIDYIIHAASTADSSQYLIHPVETILPNVLGTYSLLELAQKNHVNKFLFFSSASAYGKIKDKEVIEENDSGYLNPGDIRSCYGESKRMGENMCVSYAHEYGVNTCCVRISHTYGPTMNIEKDTRVFAEFVRNVLNNQNIEMKSEGTAKRAFCYISDATTAFFLLLLKGVSGEIYNMCNAECFVSIAELAHIFTTLYPEKNLSVIYKKREKTDSYSENKNANDVINSNKKLIALGWNPQVNLINGFKRTVESFMY